MFRFKQFAVRQDRCPMKVGTDGVLLGAWAEVRPGDRRMLDVGTGTGLIALMLAQRSAAWITAVDIDVECATQAAENFAASPWADRLDAVSVAVQRYDPVEKFDLIVSNPPYYVDSLLSPDEGRNTARHAAGLPFGCRPPAFARRTLCVGVAARRDAAIPFGGSRAALSCSLDGGLFHAPARGAAYPCGVLHDARTGSGACTSDYRTRRPGLLYGGLPPSDGGFLP
jgi:SAM-dependent methyltransferase